MRKLKLFILLFFGFYIAVSAQPVTYIGEGGNPSFVGNQGGSNDLFGFHVPEGGNMFLDWEAYNADGSVQTTICRVIVRGMTATSDPESRVASSVVCTVDGTYNGASGNNDSYNANLNVCNLPPGRYSVEIQCDELGGDYDNSTGGNTAITTWSYRTPPVWYAGTSGACGAFDPLDNIQEENEVNGGQPGQLDYFTVGDVDVYRSMVVINGLFLDMARFQPGNPQIPTSLESLQTLYDPDCVGVGSFPTDGFCSSTPLVLNGAETNIFKFDCGNGFNASPSADVTDNRLFYRVYPTAGAAPAFSNFNIPFKDNCPGDYPAGSTFINELGGSCQDLNGVLDQRWQTRDAGINLLDLAPTPGGYTVDFYTETDVTYCNGTTATIREPASATEFYTTTFQRLDDNSTACMACPMVTPVDDMATICSGNLGTAISDWQAAVEAQTDNAAAIASTSTSDIIYSLSMTASPAGTATGIHSNDANACGPETQTTYAFLFCYGADGVAGGGDDILLQLGSFVLTVNPSVRVGSVNAANACNLMVTPACVGDVMVASNPTGGASIANFDPATGVYTASSGETAGTLTITFSNATNCGMPELILDTRGRGGCGNFPWNGN